MSPPVASELSAPTPAVLTKHRFWWLRALLLGVWAAVSFGACYFARDLERLPLPGWGGSLGYWMASQGAVLVFIAIVVLYACVLNRADRRSAQPQTEVRAGLGSD